MLGGVLDILFPRACVGCGSPGWPFCPGCLTDLAWLDPPGCIRCGRSLNVSVAFCRDCPPAPLLLARAPFLYAGPVRRALMRLKFSGTMSVARAVALGMAAVTARDELLGGAGPPPSLTWVPLGPKRRRARGFDQAELLAREIGKLVGRRPVRLLARVVETPPQARRSGQERRMALRQAFEPVGEVPSSVLLIDDVLTSGSTAAACAEALLRGGASEVMALTAARSLGGPLPARCYTRARSGLGLWLPGGVPR